MVSSFNLKHNKYTSTPDWFKDNTSITDDITTSAGTGVGTGYGGSVIGSVSTTVDYNEIPIDNSTIIWQDEKLSVPIDNNTIVIKDGKLVASFEQAGVLGDYVTVNGNQDVNGLKNFKPGILIDGVEVTKPQDDVVYIGSNLVVKGGITMYADVGDIDVPNLYDGIPIDGETLFWEYDSNGNKVLKSKSGTIKNVHVSGNGNALSSVSLTEDNTALSFLKSYTFATEGDLSRTKGELITLIDTKADQTYVDETFVTFKNDEDIEGIKNFLNGIKINGHVVKQYDNYDDAIYIDTNLVVRGGITMYAEGDVDIPSILDSLPIASTTSKGIASFDSSYFNVDSDGKVTLLAENVGLNETELFDYLSRNDYAKKSDIPSLSGYATETYVEDRLDDLINGAPAAYDTLKEIADVLAGNVDSIGDIITTLGTKADKATTLAGYGITDAYTKSAVNALLGNYVTLATSQTITGEKNFTGGLKVNGSPIVYDTTNKYWKLEGDLLVTGGVTMFASDSAFTPSTIMDAIATDETNLKVVNGVLTFVGSIDGGEAGSVHWENVEGKPSFASVATSGKYSDLSGAPTLLSSFTNDLGFIDSSALNGYLLASNYTASDILAKLKTVDGEGSGLESEMTYLFKTVWAGSSSTTIDLNEWINGGFIWAYGSTGNVLNKPDGVKYSAAIEFGRKGYNSLIGQFLWDVNHKSEKDATKNLYFRASDTNGFLHSQWHTIAFTDSNVASATKLQTARTIWGQSFDGTADITGHLTMQNNNIIYFYDTSQSKKEVLRLNDANNLQIGLGTSLSGYDTFLNGNNISLRYGTSHNTAIKINSTGNVLIGTTTDGGYKLDVNGTIHASGNLYLDNNVSINFKDSIGDTKNVFHLNSLNQLFIGESIASSGYSTFISGNVVTLRYGKSKAVGLRIDESGRVGVNTPAPAYKLDVVGDIRSTTNIRTPIATIDGIPIYKSQDDVLYIDGNLAVRGGITMYATDTVDVPSIIDSLPIASTSAKGLASFDPNFFSVDDNGNVSFIGSTGITEVNWTDVVGRPTMLSSFTNDQGFASTLGELSNVGSWADSAPTQGRLLYQAKDSKVWTYKNVSDFVSENGLYLPLTGGVLTGNLEVTSITHSSPYATNIDTFGNLVFGSSGLDWSIKRNDQNKIVTLYNTGKLELNGRMGSDVPLTILSSNNQGLVIKSIATETSINYYAEAYGISWTTGINIKGELANSYCIYSTTKNENVLKFRGSDGKGFVKFGMEFENTGLTTYASNGITIGSGDAAERYITCYGKNVGYINIGKSPSNGNTGELAFHYYGDGSSNMLQFGFYGGSSSDIRIYYNSHTQVSGNLLTTGGITMYSDIRKKTKLKDVELTLQQIAEAPLIEHYYNSDAMRTTHVGSIAQYWAGLNDWFCKKDSEGFYTMEIQNAALASAISIARELSRYETKTDRKIRLLKQRVKELEDKIEKLENN